MAIIEDNSGSRKAFDAELEQLINKHSMENNSNTPDFILAEYLSLCLHAFDKATNQRIKWFATPNTGDVVFRTGAGFIADTAVNNDNESSFAFCESGNEILKLCANGDIFVRGKLVVNDMEAVDAMREWLKFAKTSKSGI